MSKSQAQSHTEAALEVLKAASTEIRAKIEVLKPLQDRLSVIQKEVRASVTEVVPVLDCLYLKGILHLLSQHPVHVHFAFAIHNHGHMTHDANVNANMIEKCGARGPSKIATKNSLCPTTTFRIVA